MDSLVIIIGILIGFFTGSMIMYWRLLCKLSKIELDILIQKKIAEQLTSAIEDMEPDHDHPTTN